MVSYKYLEQINKEIEQIKKENMIYTSEKNAFTHWTLRLSSGASDPECGEAFTGGKDDLEIDAILCVEDTPKNRIYIIQTQLPTSEKSTVKRDEIRDFWTSAVKILKDEKYARKGNSSIQAQSKLARSLLEKSDNKIYFLYLTLGSFAPNANDDIQRIKEEELGKAFDKDYELVFQGYEKDSIIDLYRRSLDKFKVDEIHPDLPIVRKEFLLRKHSLTLNGTEVKVKSLVFTTPASNIAELRNDKGLSLLSLNVRYSFSSDINKKMLETVKNKNENSKFWYFNNGIYAICENFSLEDETVKTTKLQIVNGCQTSTAFAEAASLGYDLEDVEVLMRLTAVPAKYKEFLDDISRFTNTQNPVKQRDLRSRESTQENLFMDFQNLQFLGDNYFYERKTGELSFFKKEKPVMTKNRIKIDNADAAQAFLSMFKQKPSSAKSAKDKMFIDHYDEIFPREREAHALFYPWYTYKQVDKFCKNNKGDYPYLGQAHSTLLGGIGYLFFKKYEKELKPFKEEKDKYIYLSRKFEAMGKNAFDKYVEFYTENANIAINELCELYYGQAIDENFDARRFFLRGNTVQAMQKKIDLKMKEFKVQNVDYLTPPEFRD